MYELLFFLNTNCKCEINCTAQEHHQLKSHKREEKRRRRRRCSYLSRHSQHCWMFLHHVKSWLSAVALVTQLQLQVRNLQYLQSLMRIDVIFLKMLNFRFSATGDLYTWGWGEFVLVFNLSKSCSK